MISSEGAIDADYAFFGHPKGLAYIAMSEIWERFSFYGMQALLVIYMVRHLLPGLTAEQVIGLSALRRIVEALAGPTTDIAFAAQIFGGYLGAVCFASLAGGWLGDKLQRRTACVVSGGLLMALGHVAMSFEPLFLIALLLLIAGAGLLKGNLVVQISGLYSTEDPRRSRAFAIHFITTQIGAMLAPLVCGALGEIYGWHYGFGAAAVGMVIGLAIYLSGIKHLPARVSRQTAGDRPPAAGELRATLTVLFHFIPLLLIMMAGNQAYSIFMVWASDGVDRHIAGVTMPITSFLVFDGAICVVGMALIMRLWKWQSERDREPTSVGKLIIASLLCAAGFLILYIAISINRGGAVSIPVVLLFFTVINLGFSYLYPTMNVIVALGAPPSRLALLFGVQLSTYGMASFAGGWLGRYYEILGPADFWLATSAIAASGAGVLAVAKYWPKQPVSVAIC